MKALTVKQPWASMISVGAKCVETRTWGTRYRGTIAIHAGKSWDAYQSQKLAAEPCLNLFPDPKPILGAIICVATLIECGPADHMLAQYGTEHDEELGNYGPEMWGWALQNVTPIDPIPCMGAQQLWNVPEAIIDQVCSEALRGGF